MIGSVAAVRRWMTMNHEERLATVEGKCQSILSPLRGIEGLHAEMLDNVIGHQPLGVRLRVDSSITGLTVEDVVEKLKDGDPSIWTRVDPYEDGAITIHVFGLSDGEELIVGNRIAELFK